MLRGSTPPTGTPGLVRRFTMGVSNTIAEMLPASTRASQLEARILNGNIPPIRIVESARSLAALNQAEASQGVQQASSLRAAIASGYARLYETLTVQGERIALLQEIATLEKIQRNGANYYPKPIEVTGLLTRGAPISQDIMAVFTAGQGDATGRSMAMFEGMVRALPANGIVDLLFRKKWSLSANIIAALPLETLLQVSQLMNEGQRQNLLSSQVTPIAAKLAPTNPVFVAGNEICRCRPFGEMLSFCAKQSPSDGIIAMRTIASQNHDRILDIFPNLLPQAIGQFMQDPTIRTIVAAFGENSICSLINGMDREQVNAFMQNLDIDTFNSIFSKRKPTERLVEIATSPRKTSPVIISAALVAAQNFAPWLSSRIGHFIISQTDENLLIIISGLSVNWGAYILRIIARNNIKRATQLILSNVQAENLPNWGSVYLSALRQYQENELADIIQRQIDRMLTAKREAEKPSIVKQYDAVLSMGKYGFTPLMSAEQADAQYKLFLTVHPDRTGGAIDLAALRSMGIDPGTIGPLWTQAKAYFRAKGAYSALCSLKLGFERATSLEAADLLYAKLNTDLTQQETKQTLARIWTDARRFIELYKHYQWELIPIQ